MTLTRHDLAAAQGWLCAWCGGAMRAEPGPDQATREHLTPKSWGGGDEVANLVAACRACNQARADVVEASAFRRWRKPLADAGVWPACTTATPEMGRRLAGLTASARLTEAGRPTPKRRALNRLRAAWAREERERGWVG